MRVAVADRRVRPLLQQGEVGGGRHHAPPKTFSELIADAKKLTVKNPDGSIKTFGLVTRSDYDSNANIFTGVQTNSKFYDADGKATFGTDPGWPQILELDKALQDYYGAGNVQKYVGAGAWP